MSIPYAEHIGRATRVHQWASHAGISRSTLTRKVRSTTGMTAIQALHRNRVERALAIYRAGYRLADAAEMVGFPDQFTLSNQCLRYMGARPRDLRGVS
jgi:AraC-like DNA-binding protein